MKRLFAAAFGLIFAASLAGCGSTTDNLDFKVPAGYDVKVNTFIMSLWTKGDKNDPDSMLMLFKMPVKMDETKFDSATFSSSGGVKNAKIESSQKIQICGTHPAMLVKMEGSSEQNKGKDMDMEMLVTAWGGNTYMAMYGYPHGGTADPSGEDAIKSVCQKSST